MSASFTTFAADVVGDDEGMDHILLVTACPEFPHKPKVSVLSVRCDEVMEQIHLDALP